MKIIDVLAMAQDKSIIILKTNEKYYLLSVSNTEIKLIKELDDFKENEIPVENKFGNFKHSEFNRVLKGFIENKKNDIFKASDINKK